jgi:hypothetical protein
MELVLIAVLATMVVPGAAYLAMSRRRATAAALADASERYNPAGETARSW